MENEQKLTEEVGVTPPVMPSASLPLGSTFESPSSTDYYSKKSRRISDFFLGLFCSITVPIIGALIPAVLSYPALVSGSLYSQLIEALYILFPIVEIIVFIWLVIKFFKNGRRFIAIGMLSIILLGLLIFGGCLVLLAGLGLFS